MAYTRRAGVRLHYEDAGSGPAVLLHTGGGGDGRMWDLAGYTTALAGYRTLLMDHRGHGGSDCPLGVPAHRLGEYVDDVIAVLDAAGVSTAALVGYSAGARVILPHNHGHPLLPAVGTTPAAVRIADLAICSIRRSPTQHGPRRGCCSGISPAANGLRNPANLLE